MKKILSMLGAALLLAGSLAFTSCDEASELLGNTGRWYKYTVSYNEDDSSSTSSTLICYMLYSNSTYTNGNMSKKACTNEAQTGLDAGLTIVVCNDAANSTIGKISNTSYAIHTFKKDEPVSSSGDAETFGEFGNVTIGSTFWNAFYTLKYKDLSSVSGVPVQISRDVQNTYNPVQDFSWKKILGQILIDNLLED